LHGAGGRASGYLASWFEPDVIGTTGRLARVFGPGGRRGNSRESGSAFQWFQGRLVADRAFMESLSTYEYFKRAGARMIGVGVLYTFAASARGDGFRTSLVLVDIMASVGVADVVYDAMTWSGRPLKQMARAWSVSANRSGRKRTTWRSSRWSSRGRSTSAGFPT